jgi:hypothetical protein
VEVEVRAGGRCELELELGKVAHAARRNAMQVIYELRAQVTSEGTSEGTMSAEPFATAVCDIEMR